VVSRSLGWPLRDGVVGLLVGSALRGRVLLLLQRCLSFLRKLPHGVNHGEVPLVASPLNSHGNRRPASHRGDGTARRTGLLSGNLVLLSNHSLSGLDPAVICFEILSLLHVSRQTLKIDPSLEALPWCSPFGTGRE